jgi:hypothetical protein
MSLTITKVSETSTKITLGWTPVAGCLGYAFYADGTRVSNTWDWNKSQITFSKGPAQFKVVALGSEQEGVYPPASPIPAWPPVNVTPDPWVPNRIVQARTSAEFAVKYAQALDGDRIETAEAAINGQLVLNRDFTGKGIEIVFAPDVKIMGGGQYALNAIFCLGDNHRIFGGQNIQNPTGHGVLVYPVKNFLWHGGTIGRVGGTCLRVLAVNGDIDNIDIYTEVSDCGHDESLDPHPEKGTGMHPSYIGGDESQTGTVKNSRFVIYSHDCATGSNQIGGKAEDNEFYYLAKRLTKVAANQVAGNAVQFFGNKIYRNRVWVEGEELAGRVVEANYTLGAGSFGNEVWHGRGTNVRLSPKYAVNPAVKYTDCT